MQRTTLLELGNHLSTRRLSPYLSRLLLDTRIELGYRGLAGLMWIAIIVSYRSS
jgi:hypothetical protein